MKTIRNMKTKKTLTLAGLIAIAFVLLFNTETFARSEDYKKTFKEEFKVNKDAELYIRNKFGEVVCRNWDENKVSITVEVTVEASNESKANKLLDRIDVELSGDASRVKGITDIADGSGISNVEFSIDYMIVMPKSMKVDIDNKFGDIVLDEVDGAAKLSIAYGDLEANALNSTTNDLVIKFGEGNFGYVKEADVEIAYSELEIEGSDILELDTKFSEIELGKAGEADITSQYDDYSIEWLGPVDCEAKFSDMTIEYQQGPFNFDIQYGELEVDNIAGVEGRCEVENSFGDVSLEFESGAAFYIDAEVKFGSMDYPKSNTDIKHTEEGYTTHLYEGTFGEGADRANVLYIRTKNASVSID
jgi:hypothetical protein